MGLLFVGLFVVGLVAQSVFARPDYKKAFDAKYEDAPVAEVAKELKCNVCHYGKTKKNRNDYGMALIKLGLNEDKYKELKSDKEVLTKCVLEILAKAEKEKKGEETFGDLIQAGKAPGTAPEE
jgi:hypothetical protein